MMPGRMWLFLSLLVPLILGACREPDGPVGPITGGGRMFVSSSPQGARIFLDQRDTGFRTPDTIAGLGGVHTVNVLLDTLGLRYEFSAQVAVASADTLLHVHGPLALICSPADVTACHGRLHVYHEAAGIRFASSPLGSLFLRQGQGQGLFWPQNSVNSYVSAAMPVMAGRLRGAPVSLGIYDHVYLAGRPAPETSVAGGVFRLSQETWIIPPSATLRRSMTARGMAVKQQVIASAALPGVLLIRLTFRNITGDLDYRVVDSFLGSGETFTDTYIGLALDPDIGDSGDDWFSYDPELDMVYAYDARFDEPLFTGDGANAPGLVGLRAIRAPAGALVILNGWTQGGAAADWRAGQVSEARGYDMLSGESPYLPAHPDRRIGHLPPFDGDVRISVTAGPLTMEPGAEAEIVLALVLARPAAGAFQPGLVVAPGEPMDTNREIHRIAGPLRALARLADSLLEH
jgi:hypothetical protein